MSMQAIGWSDGPPETAGNDNCAFIVLRSISIVTGILYVALKVAARWMR